VTTPYWVAGRPRTGTDVVDVRSPFDGAVAGRTTQATAEDVEASFEFMNSLVSSESLRFDGSAETEGTFHIFGGAGDDTLIAGSGDDLLFGAGGKDSLAGGGGSDIFIYHAAAESTGIGFDILTDFGSGDRIDLPTPVSGFAQSVASGQLSNASFDSDLASAVDGALEANQAILFRPSSGDHAGRTFLIVDSDGDGAYSEGADYVFELGDAVIIDTGSNGIFL